MTTPEDVTRKTGTRFSFFVESGQGLKGYFEVAIEDVVLLKDETALDAMTRTFAHTAKTLAAMGFKHDTSFDKPAYGGGGGWKGGNKRPDDVAPAGLVIPDHDDKPMKFIAGGKRQDGTEFKPRFVCSAGNACTEKDPQGRPFATWKMHDPDGKPFKFADPATASAPSQQGQSAAGGAARPPAANGSKEGEMGWGEFLNKAVKIGYVKSEVLKFEHTNEDELKRLGPQGWQEVLDRLRAANTKAVEA